MKQIADEACVSIGTVSNVLNGKAPVTVALKSRVEAAIDKLGYVPDQSGRSLRRRRSDIVGMIIPDIGNPFFPSVVRGVEDAIFEQGQQLILCNSDNDPAKQRSYVSAIRSYRPAGLIVIATGDDDAFSGMADGGGPFPFPMVCIDRQPAGWRGDSVVSANRAGGGQAAEHLLALGHDRIAVIGGPEHLSSSRDRIAGFVDRVRGAGLDIAPDAIRIGRFDRASGYAAAAALLGSRRQPTAIFAANDLMAAGALLAVRDAGLACPAAISIIGFDDLDMDELTDPPLTSIRQCGHALGQAAARLLHRRLADHDATAEHLVMATTLTLRRSTGPVPPRPTSR